MRMKHRWIGGLLLAAALSLGACAPPDQGADESAAPTPGASDATEAEGASPTPTPAPTDPDEY
jgi:hypothetical protein